MATWKKVLTADPIESDLASDTPAAAGEVLTSITADGTGIPVWAPPAAATSLILDGHTISDIDITAEFNDVDDHLMSSAAIKAKIEDYGYSTTSGDITGVSFTTDDSTSISDNNGSATFTITGGTGLATSSADSTITLTLDGQLEDIAGMGELVTTALATLTVNEISSLDTTSSIATSLAAKALLAGDAGQNFNTNDLTVAGNLTVDGTTITTDTETLLISDSKLVLNSDLTTSADVDAGIIVERGASSDNALFWWDEGDDKWKIGTNAALDFTTTPTYGGDVMQVNINGAYDNVSTLVPVGHLQYHDDNLYVRIDD